MFFAKVCVLLRCLVGVLTSGEHVKSRQMCYTALANIKRRERVKLVDDMAVTLHVHLYNLLLEYEENGQFRIGHRAVNRPRQECTIDGRNQEEGTRVWG